MSIGLDRFHCINICQYIVHNFVIAAIDENSEK